MYRLTFYILFIAATFINLQAQQKLSPIVISSGGGYSIEGSYSLSFTIGEPFVKTITTNSNILTEGFQQGKFGSSFYPQIIDTKVFPNPVISTLHVNIKVNETATYYLRIYSLTGKLILAKEYSDYQSGAIGGYYDIIDFSNYVKGLYLIKIESLDRSMERTFKIEKL